MGTSNRGPRTAAEVIAERDRRLAEDPEFRAQMEAVELELAERARVLLLAEQPIVADLAAVGIEVTSVWDLYDVPWSRDRGIPVLLDHLTRDYPDDVLRGVSAALEDRSARDWWPQLKALYLATNRDVVRDRLAAALSVMAIRAHFDDLVSFLGNEQLGATRIYFLRPVNRIGNRMSPGKGRAIVSSLATDPVFAVAASAILAGRGPND